MAVDQILPAVSAVAHETVKEMFDVLIADGQPTGEIKWRDDVHRDGSSKSPPPPNVMYQ